MDWAYRGAGVILLAGIWGGPWEETESDQGHEHSG